MKRQRPAEALDATETSFRLGEYLEGKRAEPPWEAMGMSRAPIMAGAPHLPCTCLLMVSGDWCCRSSPVLVACSLPMGNPKFWAGPLESQ